MKLTINQLRVELASLIQSNAQVNSFFWGDFARAETEVEQQYPLVYAYTTSGIQINKNTDVIPLVIGVCDKLFKNWVNLNDVESDTLQIARGVFNAINQSPKWQKIGSIQSCSANKFIDKGKDEVAGYILTISFKLRDTSSYCDEPFFGYDWNGTLQGSCLPVQIFKNGVLIETIPAGGLYSYTENPCPPIEVDAVVLNTNSDIVATKTVTPTDNEIEAPDGIVHIKKENDGTISNAQTPSGATTDYIVQNNDITVNGGNDFEIHATESLDVRLRDESNNVVNPISVTHTGSHATVVLPTNEIDVTINGITVADDVISDVALTLVDQNGDDVPFTQTGAELEVNTGGGGLFDLEINVDGVLKQTIPLDSQENNVINVNLYA